MPVAYISSDLALTGLTPEQIRTWQARVTYKDPRYTAAFRAGRYTGNLSEWMTLARVEDGPGGPTLVLPRGLLSEVEEKLAPEIHDCRIRPPLSSPVHLAADLRDYQDAARDAAEEAEQGVIQAPTGSGKTVMGMSLIAALGTPALFVVHTRVLLEQTANEMRSLLGVVPGVIGDGRYQPQDVTVAMVQTLQRMDPAALRQLRRRFGLVIADECHHCPAETFRSVLSSFPAKYRFGLTATPTRKDGMHPVLYDTLGPIIYRVAPGVLLDKGAIIPAEVVTIPTGWCPRSIPTVKMSGAQVARLALAGQTIRPQTDSNALMNLLCGDAERNQLVVDRIRDLHEERSLVLTERVEHAEALAEALQRSGLLAMAMLGKTAKTARRDILERLKAGTLPVMVSIPGLVGEGFNLPTIDTVFLAAPNGNVTKTTQILGRVLRPAPGKARGRIVDFVDEGVPSLQRQAQERRRVYRTFERAPLTAAMRRSA